MTLDMGVKAQWSIFFLQNLLWNAPSKLLLKSLDVSYDTKLILNQIHEEMQSFIPIYFQSYICTDT